MRISVRSGLLAGLVLLCAGCGRKEAQNQQNMPAVANAAVPGGDGLIDCATGGGTAFAHACTVERTTAGGTAVLVLRAPDGGFRRLRSGPGGFSAADGAEPAIVTPLPGGIVEVAIGRDRYRLPPALQRGQQ